MEPALNWEKHGACRGFKRCRKERGLGLRTDTAETTARVVFGKDCNYNLVPSPFHSVP